MVRFPIRSNKRLDTNRPAVVYGIFDPLSKELVYIGYTVNFKSRVSYHLSGANECNKKAVYIKYLKMEGLSPDFKILNEFDNVFKAKEYEIKLIAELNPIYNTKTTYA